MPEEREPVVQIVVKRMYQGDLFNDRRILHEGVEEVTPAQAEYLISTFPDWFSKVPPAKAGKPEKAG